MARITFITVVVGKGHMRWTGLFLSDILNSCGTFHTACTSFWIPKRQDISTEYGFIFEKKIKYTTYLTHIFLYVLYFIGFSFSWNYFLEWDYYGYLKFLREYLQLTGELKSYQNLEKFTSKIFFDLGTWPIYSTCFKVCTFFSYLSVRGMSLKLFLKWEKEAKP